MFFDLVLIEFTNDCLKYERLKVIHAMDEKSEACPLSGHTRHLWNGGSSTPTGELRTGV